MASKQPSVNTTKSPIREEMADSTKKLGKLTINVKKPATSVKDGAIETHEVEDKGQVVARYVKKDGKVLESSATLDMQATGNADKSAKSAGVKKEDLISTNPAVNMESAGDNQVSSEDEKVESVKLSGKSKEVKPKKVSEGKVDGSLKEMASISSSLEKADKITDISKTKAFSAQKTKEKRDAMANTLRMVDLVKKLTQNKATYNPKDASGVAQQIRDVVGQKQAEGVQSQQPQDLQPTPIKPVLAKASDNSGAWIGKKPKLSTPPKDPEKKPSTATGGHTLDYKEMNKIKTTKEGGTIDYSKLPPPPDKTPNWKKRMDATAPKPAEAPTPKGVIIKKPEQKAKGVILKKTEDLKKDLNAGGVASISNAFGGGSSAPSSPSAPQPSLGSSITSGINSLLGKADDKKWPVPGIVPPKMTERPAKANPHSVCLSFLNKACSSMRGQSLEMS
jgi:hypothetical protein